MSHVHGPFTRAKVGGAWNISPLNLLPALKAAFPASAFHVRYHKTTVTITCTGDDAPGDPEEIEVVALVDAVRAAYDPQDRIDADASAQADLIIDRLQVDPLAGLSVGVAVDGLDIAVNIGDVVPGETVSIESDPADAKTVMVCYVYDDDAEELGLVVYEKTTGAYADLSVHEEVIKCLGEWRVAANGFELTETADGE